MAAGAKVSLLDRDSSAVTAAANELRQGEVKTLPLVADVTSSAGVERAVAECTTAFGGLDVLVANAGLSFARAIDEVHGRRVAPDARHRSDGAFYAVRAAVPHLKRNAARSSSCRR